jgi:hypothetical protein
MLTKLFTPLCKAVGDDVELKFAEQAAKADPTNMAAKMKLEQAKTKNARERMAYGCF